MLVGKVGTQGLLSHGPSCLTTLWGSWCTSSLGRLAVVCADTLQILKQFCHFSWGPALSGAPKLNLLGRYRVKGTLPSRPHAPTPPRGSLFIGRVQPLYHSHIRPVAWGWWLLVSTKVDPLSTAHLATGPARSRGRLAVLLCIDIQELPLDQSQVQDSLNSCPLGFGDERLVFLLSRSCFLGTGHSLVCVRSVLGV